MVPSRAEPGLGLHERVAVAGHDVHVVVDIGYVEVVHRTHGAGRAHAVRAAHVHVHGAGQAGRHGRGAAHALGAVVGVHGRHRAQLVHAAQPAVHGHAHTVHGRLHLQVVLVLHHGRGVDGASLAGDAVLDQHGHGHSARGGQRVELGQPLLLACPLQLVAVVLKPDLHLGGRQADDGRQVLPLRR